MPAFKFAVASALLLSVTLSGIAANIHPLANGELSLTTSAAVSSALQWLASNQSSTGSYGDYFDHWTAAAAHALWLNNSHSQKAALSYSWLGAQLNASTSWFWGQYGEADVPGAMLHSVAAGQNLDIINVTGVSSRLLELQEQNGGFRGYFDPTAGPYGQNVASAVDTALALWGLADAGTINATSRQAAIDYLISLQNSNGSFNLTKTTKSDPIYSHAPESVSITALALLSLKAASYINDARVTKALDFLSVATSKNFTDPNTTESHVYSASLTALALNALGRGGDASKPIAFILSHQNPDGGFRDSIRSSRASNALDTGWVAIGLQLVQTKSLSPDLLVVGGLIASVAAPVGVLGVTAYYFRKRRKSLQKARHVVPAHLQWPGPLGL